MEESKSSIPIFLDPSTAENAAPEPRRSGRVRTSTQRFESIPQPASSSSKSSGKRKRSNTTQNDESDLQKDDNKTHAQGGTKTKPRATINRVANNESTKSDDANAKPTTKSRPSQHAGNVIDLTEDNEATSSKKSKISKPGEGEEQRIKP
jgi:hypothetical protein